MHHNTPQQACGQSNKKLIAIHISTVRVSDTVIIPLVIKENGWIILDPLLSILYVGTVLSTT